jgi:hypothetical protein
MYVVRVTVSQEAAEYISNKKRMTRPNIIIYRDLVFRAASAPSAMLFSTEVKVDGKEPDELFTVVGNSHGIPIWVERGLLPKMSGPGSFEIVLKKGIVKRLKIVERPPVQEPGSEQITE